MLAALASAGCGYVGEPLPPALNVPQRAADVTATQIGARIVVRYSPPQLSTDGLNLKNPGRAELAIGPAPSPFQAGAWAAQAKIQGEFKMDGGMARAEIPVADWAGQEVVAAVRLYSPKGRQAGWSNFVTLAVVPPLESPRDVLVEAVPTGVRIRWQAAPGRFRVLRRSGKETNAVSIGEAGGVEYVDATAEFGLPYRYSVEAIRGEGNVRAFSERTAEVEILPEDHFPPAVPAGVSAVASTGSIEIAWEQNSEPDLAGYRIYRAQGASEFTRIGETQTAPNFSDRTFRSGERYRYAVSSVDKVGNESTQSPPVELVAP
jgi:hypothetical protein